MAGRNNKGTETYIHNMPESTKANAQPVSDNSESTSQRSESADRSLSVDIVKSEIVTAAEREAVITPFSLITTSTNTRYTQIQRTLNRIGISVNRPEILLVNEFKPLANFSNGNYNQQNTENLSAANSTIKYRNVIKIIEMHRSANNISLSGLRQVIEDFSGLTIDNHIDILNYFKLKIADSNTRLNIFNSAGNELLDIDTITYNLISNTNMTIDQYTPLYDSDVPINDIVDNLIDNNLTYLKVLCKIAIIDWLCTSTVKFLYNINKLKLDLKKQIFANQDLSARSSRRRNFNNENIDNYFQKVYTGEVNSNDMNSLALSSTYSYSNTNYESLIKIVANLANFIFLKHTSSQTAPGAQNRNSINFFEDDKNAFIHLPEDHGSFIFGEKKSLQKQFDDFSKIKIVDRFYDDSQYTFEISAPWSYETNESRPNANNILSMISALSFDQVAEANRRSLPDDSVLSAGLRTYFSNNLINIGKFGEGKTQYDVDKISIKDSYLKIKGKLFNTLYNENFIYESGNAINSDMFGYTSGNKSGIIDYLLFDRINNLSNENNSVDRPWMNTEIDSDEIDEYSNITNSLFFDITSFMSLDFDKHGKESVTLGEEGRNLLPGLNPASYLNYYNECIAQTLEELLINPVPEAMCNLFLMTSLIEKGTEALDSYLSLLLGKSLYTMAEMHETDLDKLQKIKVYCSNTLQHHMTRDILLDTIHSSPIGQESVGGKLDLGFGTSFIDAEYQLKTTDQIQSQGSGGQHSTAEHTSGTPIFDADNINFINDKGTMLFSAGLLASKAVTGKQFFPELTLNTTTSVRKAKIPKGETGIILSTSSWPKITVPDTGEVSAAEEINKKYFGELINANMENTTNISIIAKWYMFHIYAAHLFNKTISIALINVSNNGVMYFKYCKKNIRNVIKALRRKQPDEPPESEVEMNLSPYDNLYGTATTIPVANLPDWYEAVSFLNSPFEIMIERRDQIVEGLAIIKRDSGKLGLFKSSFDSYLGIRNTLPGTGFLINTLKNIGFLDTYHVVNSIQRSNIFLSYMKNFTYSRDSFPLSKYDVRDLTDYDMMCKILTRTGYGFLSNEKHGMKNILHIGIPVNMIEMLREKTFSSTGLSEYEHSSLICIKINRINHINEDEVTIPKMFIFDMSKYILPFHVDSNGNLIEQDEYTHYTDSTSVTDIINKKQIYRLGISDKLKPVGKGIEGFGTEKSENYTQKNTYKDSLSEQEYNGFKKEILINHINDYYLKLYIKSTIGIDVSETNFQILKENKFYGQATNDTNSKIIYDNIYDFIHENRIDKSEKPNMFNRAINFVKNTIPISQLEKFNDTTSFKTFDRIFSFLINSEDFLLDPNASDQTSITGVWRENEEPIYNINGIVNQQGIPANINIVNPTVKYYIDNLNDPKGSIYGYVASISLLKHW
jgi:hypothetical protein